MENVVLIIHLILALSLIGIVLMQRSEGGGLGMGSGGGVGGVMSGRAAATALGKITWALAAAFICTSIALTVIAASNSSDSSVLDRLGGTAPTATEEQSDAPAGSDLLPPSSSDAPLVPSAN
jgi:preprotein translocase subunit SecG